MNENKQKAIKEFKKNNNRQLNIKKLKSFYRKT